MDRLRRISHTALTLLLLGVSTASGEGIPWQTDLEQATRLATQTNRLVLVHFWAEWCQPCQRLDEQVFCHPQVAAALDANFVPVKLNADHFAATARGYGVDSLPTDVVLTAEGKVVERLNSPMTAVAYVNQMNQIATTHRLQSGQQLAAQTPPSHPHTTQATAPLASNNPYAGFSAAPTTAQPAPSSVAVPAKRSPFAAPPAPAAPAGPSAPFAAAPPQPAPAAPAAAPYDPNGYRDFAAQAPQATAPQMAAPAPPSAAQPSVGDRYAMPASDDRYGLAASVPAASPAAAATPSPEANRYGQMPLNENRYGAHTVGNYAPPAAAMENRHALEQPAPQDRYGAGPAQPQDRYGAGPSQAGTGVPASAPANNPYLTQQGAPADAAASNPYQMANRYAAPPQAAPAEGTAAVAAPASAPSAPTAAMPNYQMPPSLAQQSPTPPPPAAGDNPPLGLEGFCPVTLMEGQKWQAGDRRFGAIHRGRTYLFTGKEQQERFLANPDLYSPALSGVDPVLALEQGQQVPGHRRHGVYYRDRIYLFSTEASLARFSQNPEHYAQGVRQAMQAPAAGQLPRR